MISLILDMQFSGLPCLAPCLVSPQEQPAHRGSGARHLSRLAWCPIAPQQQTVCMEPLIGGGDGWPRTFQTGWRLQVGSGPHPVDA